jgi:hypothetical protein
MKAFRRQLLPTEESPIKMILRTNSLGKDRKEKKRRMTKERQIEQRIGKGEEAAATKSERKEFKGAKFQTTIRLDKRQQKRTHWQVLT